MSNSSPSRLVIGPGQTGPRRLALHDPVQYVRGVGPARAREFAKLGVETIGDLLEYFPYRHELIPRSVPIGNLRIDETATVVGQLHRVRVPAPYSKSPISAQVVDGTGRCAVRWFHSPHLSSTLRPGLFVRVTGKVTECQGQGVLTNPMLTVLDEDEPFAGDVDRMVPIYSATAKLPTKAIAAAIKNVLDAGLDAELLDPLPEAIRVRRRVPTRRLAVVRMHRPTSQSDIDVARRRLAYDELFILQAAVQLSRKLMADGPPAPVIAVTPEIDRRIRTRLPFELTAAQDNAVREIRDDLKKKRPMNRLLQGDVGCGKTAVAVYAALAAVANKQQVAFVAPTEILAQQHWAKLQQYLLDSRVSVACLSSSTSRDARAEILKSLSTARLNVIVGTHALFERDVRFSKLGLVIVDEQHRFGVRQRARLRAKGRAPHVLVMTATPIPRTLAMTLYGDLDITTIDGVLPGRRPVPTRVVEPGGEAELWRHIRARLISGEQAFIVCPLIDDSPELPLRAAAEECRRLKAGPLSGVGVDLLHGRMRPVQKNSVMDGFRDGSVQALVCTSVIEVGIDVPNATIIVIQHADRYGLAQLHQLRGRVGRGTKESACFLLAGEASETARERLRVLCETSDGFRISEEDLRLRGPGELLGTRQHGLPLFRVANLVTDKELIPLARNDAAAVLAADPRLADSQNALLRRAVHGLLSQPSAGLPVHAGHAV